MNKLYKILCLCCGLIMTVSPAFSQVLIGSENGEADKDAVLELNSGGNKGLLLPRIDLVDVNESTPMTEHKAGMVVYNLGSTIPAGYYFNDGSQWVMITDTKIASWNNINTREGATSNTDNIYQTGGVAVGTADLDLYAKFAVNSDNKGFLMPRLTNQEIYTLTQTDPVGAPDGLTVYNLTTKCVNYYEGGAQKWVSLCREETPSSMSVEPCSSGCGPFPATEGAYTAYVPLTSDNFYRVQIRVNVPGPYKVRIDTDNGYTFEQSGTFTEPGLYTLDLPGQGIPARKADPGDEALVFLNGENVTASLPYPLPVIPVAAGSLGYEVVCSNSLAGTPVGEYVAKQPVEVTTHYVDISVNVIASGKAVIETNQQNGLIFRSDDIELSSEDSPATVRLYAYGTPDKTGIYSYTIQGAQCPFNLEVITKLGEFISPAKNCYEIYEAGVETDGEYWIKTSASNEAPVKTFCDMTNGGWTLVWSFSEKTLRDRYVNSGTNGMSMYKTSDPKFYLKANNPFNVATDENADINYYNYRLSNATMTNVKQNSSDPSEYKVRIAYDPKNVNDYWGNENFVIMRPVSSTYDLLTATGLYSYSAGNKVPSAGKIFNLEFTQNNTQSPTTVVYGPNSRTADISAFYYGVNDYGNHWDSGFGRMPGGTSASSELITEVSKPDGSKYPMKVRPYYFNNVYGAINEADINHHIGKCVPVNSSADQIDDFGNADGSCEYTRKYPHSFNEGEGRVIQWWVK
ncbi:MAG: hypothetical protein LIO93_12155 [Bacteroidales bacterium]|nr:hypothetical protein [Bacteroidales bacterium]